MDEERRAQLVLQMAELSNEALLKLFAVNTVATVLARAAPNPKTSVFIEVHEVALDEMRRRGLKARGGLM